MTYRFANFASEADNIIRDEVGQISILASIPNLLRGIKIRCIRGQPLDFDALGKEPTESVGSRSVDRPAIHNKYKSMR